MKTYFVVWRASLDRTVVLRGFKTLEQAEEYIRTSDLLVPLSVDEDSNECSEEAEYPFKGWKK